MYLELKYESNKVLQDRYDALVGVVLRIASKIFGIKAANPFITIDSNIPRTIQVTNVGFRRIFWNILVFSTESNKI